MAALPLELPTIQNWNCHNCAGCCRQHAIEVTDEERRRIEGQGWTESDGIPADRPLFVPYGGPPWKRRYRLAHQPDGSCVFLDENGLCRIHGKFGEEAKPLACRIYPYAFHPAGKKVAVSLRFSCPSVVGNHGQPVAQQKRGIKRLARSVVPETAGEHAPPRVNGSERVEWPDFLRLVEALDETLSDGEAPMTVKLLRALFWVGLVDEAKFAAVRGERLAEFLQLITEAAAAQFPEVPAEMDEPTRIGRTQFRMLVAQYARRDTFADRQAGWGRRWFLFCSALRFARGTGGIPALQDAFREVPFDAVEGPFGGIPDEAEELFTRYFRVKVQGLHFCGPAYYGVPFAEGFQSLALVYPAVLWLARWLAAGEGRDRLQLEDVQRALAIADHHHGYSPAFGHWGARRRVRTLQRLGDVGKLCVRYGG